MKKREEGRDMMIRKSLNTAVGLTFLVSLMSLDVAFAADSEFSVLQEEQQGIIQDKQEKQARIKEIKLEMGQLKRSLNRTTRTSSRGKDSDEDYDTLRFSGDCNSTCLPERGFCANDTFEILNLKKFVSKTADEKPICEGLEPASTECAKKEREARINAAKTRRTTSLTGSACVAIYKAAYPSLDEDEAISTECADVVRECGYVAKLEEIKAMGVEVAELEEDVKGLDNQIKQIRKDMALAYQQCPGCAMQSQMQGQMYREPGLGDYILGGLGIAANFGTNLLYTNMYTNSTNRYYGSYNNYLDGCVTIGIPCMPPGGFNGGAMGGMGYSGYGMGGGYPMGGMGYGMGGGYPMMGGMGMGGYPGMGAGFGLNIGLGAGAGMGMGYPGMGYGMPMMGAGMGMGMPMGGMGYGMGGGYPMMGAGMMPMMSMMPMMGAGMGMGMPMGGMGYGMGGGYPMMGGMMPGYGMGMPGAGLGFGLNAGIGAGMPMMGGMMPGYGMGGGYPMGGMGYGMPGYGMGGGYPMGGMGYGMPSYGMGGGYPMGGMGYGMPSYGMGGGYPMMGSGMGYGMPSYGMGGGYPMMGSGMGYGMPSYGMGGGYPMMGGMGGGYPTMGGGMYPGAGMGGMYPGGGFGGGMGMPGGGFGTGGINPQYTAMMQASMQSQMLQQQRDMQQQQNMMIAQQQMMEAMSRYQQTASGAAGGPFGSSIGGFNPAMGGGVSGGLGGTRTF